MPLRVPLFDAVGSVFTGWPSHPPILNIFLLSLGPRLHLRSILELAEFLVSPWSWSYVLVLSSWSLGQASAWPLISRDAPPDLALRVLCSFRSPAEHVPFSFDILGPGKFRVAKMSSHNLVFHYNSSLSTPDKSLRRANTTGSLTSLNIYRHLHSHSSPIERSFVAEVAQSDTMSTAPLPPFLWHPMPGIGCVGLQD